jgi:NAD(P)-dependent dehydrogenase (short-subunit alcohol dehydrogenase family)
MKLKDKVIVITGSTRGIGHAIAEACAKEGALLVICSRHESAVKETCEEFTKQGFSVSGVTKLGGE